MLNFLLSPLGRYVTAALAAVLLLAGVYTMGRMDGVSSMTAKYLQEKLQWQSKITLLQTEHTKEVAVLSAQYRMSQSELETEIEKLRNKPAEVVTKVVEVYIPQSVDTTVPSGFIELHNDAANGNPLRQITSVTSDEPSTKKLSDVGAVVAENYYSCNATINQLNTLQDIVREFQIKQKDLVK